MTVPAVTAISPIFGSESGGNTVTVTGTSFIAGSTVAFGANPATGVVINSVTSITCVSPAGVAGVVDVEVTNAGGTSSAVSADNFTYIAAPAVLAAYVDVDYSARNSVLVALATMVNNWNTYWSSATTKCIVPDQTCGQKEACATSLKNIATCVVAMNAEFTMGVKNYSNIDSDWSNFQSTANGIIAQMILMQAVKP